MTITILGYLILPIGMMLLMIKPAYLLYCVVLLCGWSGSSIITFDTIGFSFQPAYYFAILWMLWRMKNLMVIRKTYIFQYRYIRWLMLFMGISTLSIIMPIILQGRSKIMDIDGKISLLRFTSSNITQLIYLWFCFFFFCILADHLYRRTEDLIHIEEIYCIGALGVCLISLYQIVAFEKGWIFDEIFRTSIHGNIQGKRIYGPCIEASMLAYYLISVLPISIRIKRQTLGFVVFGLCIAIGVKTYSSTFFVGLILWMILENVFFLYRNCLKLKKTIIFRAGLMVMMGVAMVLMFNLHLSYMFEKFLDTIMIKNVSGVERSEALLLLMAAAKRSLIFGVGFGSCRGKDLFSTWLADVGIVGMAFIGMFLWEILKRGNRYRELICSNIIVWIAMFISVPEPYNLFIWLLLGCMAVPVLDDKDKRIGY